MAESRDLEVDVVIIGAGATGLPSAIKAADEGASVLVVEANYDVGGHAISSGGNIPLGCGTSAQKKYGIDDSPDCVFADSAPRENHAFWTDGAGLGSPSGRAGGGSTPAARGPACRSGEPRPRLRRRIGRGRQPARTGALHGAGPHRRQICGLRAPLPLT